MHPSTIVCVRVYASARAHVYVAVRGTRGTLYEWNVSTPSVAREAPVCPTCKHNNTDVSIHQVDPDGAVRPREMPLEAPRYACMRVHVYAFIARPTLAVGFFIFHALANPPRGYLKGDSSLDCWPLPVNGRFINRPRVLAVSVAKNF